MISRLLAIAAVASAAALTASERLPAQAARVHGIVLDSSANRPLGDVRVHIHGTQWSTRTGADGRFSLPAAGGQVTVVAQRLGYRRTEVMVGLPMASADPLVVRLAAQPAQLAGVVVEEAAAPPLAQTITAATVRQLPPLVEPDVFRAIAFMPGVLQPNDLRGRLHVTGGRSDETGVRLNGHPLQNPFHLAELMSAFSVAAIERADVLIHHIPPEYADRLSGVVDLVTRRPRARSVNESIVSLVASSLTTTQPALPGGLSLLASGRVTYLDKYLRLRYSGSDLARHPDIPLYGFVDGILAVDRTWPGGTQLQVTGFATRDQVDFFGDKRTGYRPYGWGEWLLGASLRRTDGPRTASARLSLGRGSARYDSGAEDPQQVAFYPGFPLRSQLATLHERLSAEGRMTWQSARWTAAGALTLDRWRADQSWLGTDALARQDVPLRYNGGDALTAVGAVAQATFAPRPRLTVGAQARLWVVDDRVLPAPGAWLSARLTPTLSAQLAVERRLQFDSELAEPKMGIGRAPVFLLRTPREAHVAGLSLDWAPAARDSASNRRAASGDAPLRLRAQAFAKDYRRRTFLPEGPLFGLRDTIAPPGFPQFLREGGRSYGLMIGGRVQPHRRLLVEGAYTYQRALEEVEGVLAPTAWDAPHQGAGVVSLLVPGKLIVNLAAQGRSGVAVTGVARRIMVPNVDGGFRERYIDGPRNGVNLPPYFRADAGLRRTWTGRVEWTLSLQFINVIYRQNPTGIAWLPYFCSKDPARSCDRPGFGDFEPFDTQSLPIIPSLGFEVRW